MKHEDFWLRCPAIPMFWSDLIAFLDCNVILKYFHFKLIPDKISLLLTDLGIILGGILFPWKKIICGFISPAEYNKVHSCLQLLYFLLKLHKGCRYKTFISTRAMRLAEFFLIFATDQLDDPEQIISWLWSKFFYL